MNRLEARAVLTGPGLYVHVPFCRRRCGYCAFASGVFDPARAEAYVEAVGRELGARAGAAAFSTAFIGGGTPTALGAALLARLLTKMAPATRAVDEFSMEANPGGFTPALADVARRGGVDRISFGVQTFQPRGLAALDRAQDPDDATRAVAVARSAGFARIGVDLIAGWPGQTLAEWRDDLDRALALSPEHISCYGLSVEPGTPLARAIEAGGLPPPDEDRLRDCWDEAGARLAAAGLDRYEVSNHARAGAACRHHVNYWTGGDYAGVGAAAHSHEAGRRFANTDDVDAYIRAWSADGRGADVEAFSERLPPEAKARETLTVWLRLVDGVDTADFAERTGFVLPDLIAAELPALLASGGLRWSADGRRLSLTAEALPVADAVLCELVAASEA